ncbi:Fic family protein [Candidatus Micrarchaeota archaeon]|nr:Fic family protein [Candidatus Micrarchaeota archaeon]MBI5176943.1 Fic family protein [Candidatus Micrarchaeota archaeon]
MRTRLKVVNGRQYYYLEESIRLEKPVVYSVFLGKRIPAKKELEAKKEGLLAKMYGSLLAGAERLFLSREQLVEAEKLRRRYVQKVRKLGKVARDEREEVDAVNFVYTTLTTEGVPITREDANLAYKFDRKNVKNLRDENLRVALDMIKGLRFVKEGKKGLTLDFLARLHGIIMAQYGERAPGEFRSKQAYIYLKSYQRAEEIGFRPPAHQEVTKKLRELVEWYNANEGTLNAIELAALLHLRFYMIHPFEDGNKRVSRLLLNKALFDKGYPLLNISKDSRSYFDALITAVERRDEKAFVQFVYEQFIARK